MDRATHIINTFLLFKKSDDTFRPMIIHNDMQTFTEHIAGKILNLTYTHTMQKKKTS